MTALLTVETLLLALLALLVVGLLRSHAEILRRLESIDPSDGPGATAPPADRADGLPDARPGPTPAFDLVGTTLAGGPIKVAVRGTGRTTMLAFLSSGCTPCVPFWGGLRRGDGPRLPGGARVVVVTKDRALESSSRLRELEPSDAPMVMSSEAWEAYAVQGSPYFILVDGRADRVVGEGTALDWGQVSSLVRDAAADVELAGGRTGRDSTPRRLRRADRELEAAGILPGDPSLYGGAARPVPQSENGSNHE